MAWLSPTCMWKLTVRLPSDNNEWGLFELQYGMQLVNRTNGEFTRTYKRSMFDYVDFFHTYVESGSR